MQFLLHDVEEMGTKDVFKYFQEFGPGSVEWIDSHLNTSLRTRLVAIHLCEILPELNYL